MVNKTDWNASNATELFKAYRGNERELSKLQRDYKNLLRTKMHVFENKKKSVQKNLDQMGRERQDLKTQLNVALATTHQRQYEQQMSHLQVYVECQDTMQSDIKTLHAHIEHLDKQIRCVDKEMYELNRKATSEHQYNMNLEKARKKLIILENQLDVSRKRECNMISENNRLKKMIENMLHQRQLFNKLWHRMITNLGRDKKFLIDLADRAKGTLVQGTDTCQKLTALREKRQRDNRMRVHEMQELLRKLDTDQRNNDFLSVKGQHRKLADLQPKEYRRRSDFKTDHEKRISLYKAILDKILTFSNVANITQAIEKFQKQENIYYSYFNYMNELNYQVELLNGYLKDLYDNIDSFRTHNVNKLSEELNLIKKLEDDLSREEQLSQVKIREKQEYDEDLEFLFRGIYEIFQLLNCDSSPLMLLLGDHTKITIFNVKKFLKILEKRLNTVLACIYVTERKEKKVRSEYLTIRAVDRPCEEPAIIEDIVLAQQCAECAEGEDVNPYDEEFVMPMSMEQVKAKIREKVVAPEMQYRLHSISECRLPRSRLLASKR